MLLYENYNNSNENIITNIPNCNYSKVFNQYFIESEEYSTFKILIPKEYARGETNEYPSSYEEAESIQHYELVVFNQVGDSRSRRGTYVLYKLPVSDIYMPIYLYPDEGIGYDEKRYHTILIRETDELDRRIVLGFCKKYQDKLRSASYSNSSSNKNALIDYGLTYRASKMPLRIKRGRGYNADDIYINGKYHLTPDNGGPLLYR